MYPYIIQLQCTFILIFLWCDGRNRSGVDKYNVTLRAAELKSSNIKHRPDTLLGFLTEDGFRNTICVRLSYEPSNGKYRTYTLFKRRLPKILV